MSGLNRTAIVTIWAFVIILVIYLLRRRRRQNVEEEEVQNCKPCEPPIVIPPECVVDTDCTNSKICRGGTCVAPPGRFRLSDTDPSPLVLPVATCPTLHFLANDPAFNLFGYSANCQSQDPWVYIHSGNFLARVNVQTQQFVMIGDMGLQMFDIGFGSDGILYAINAGGNALYSLNTNTGLATFIATAGTMGGSPGSNSLCGGPNHTLYGINGNLQVTNLDTLTVSTLRTGLSPTLGDCVFNKGELWWSAYGNRLYKIAGNVATGPIVNVGPCGGGLYGLAVVNCELWGFDIMTIYKIDQTNGATSNAFTIPSFGFGFIQGAAKRDEAIQSGTYLATVQSLSCLPINVTSDETVTINFTDPNFTHQIVVLAGGSFTIDATYTAVNFVNAWLAI
jgi:hypothetical protein